MKRSTQIAILLAAAVTTMLVLMTATQAAACFVYVGTGGYNVCFS